MPKVTLPVSFRTWVQNQVCLTSELFLVFPYHCLSMCLGGNLKLRGICRMEVAQVTSRAEQVGVLSFPFSPPAFSTSQECVLLPYYSSIPRAAAARSPGRELVGNETSGSTHLCNQNLPFNMLSRRFVFTSKHRSR